MIGGVAVIVVCELVEVEGSVPVGEIRTVRSPSSSFIALVTFTNPSLMALSVIKQNKTAF